MDILDSPLGLEIKRISQAGATSSNYYWSADIHYTANETVPAFKVLSIDFVCDYLNNFTDEVIMRIAIGRGKYAYRLYPNLDKLEVTLYKITVNEIGGGSVESEPVKKERYVAKIIDPRNPAIAGNGFNQPSENALDLVGMDEYDIQLVPKAVDQFRMRSFGTTMRKVTVEQAIKGILSAESKLIKVDSDSIPIGVEMVAANNQKVREHIVIPQGTRLVDVPGYIHQKCGGVYNTGFSYYFNTDTWFVFPPYNNVDFAKSMKTLTLIRIPPNRMPGNERTFSKDGTQVTAIVTGESKISNKSESQILNAGNGVRFGDGDKFMEDFVKVSDNKAIAARGGSNNEFTTINRPDGYNNVLNSDQRITSNPFVEYSRLAARDGVYLSVSWENSDPTLTYPGMPVKVVFMESDELRETYGTLIHAHHYVQTLGDGFQTNRHICTSNLTVFVKREIDISTE